MPAISGKLARIRFGSLIATTSTNQACTLSSCAGATTGGINLQINTTSRRRWDPTLSSTHYKVYGGATTSTLISSTAYDIDYAIGQVRFHVAKTTAPTKAYTMDVPWLATSYLRQAKAWTLNVNQDMLECTAFSTGAAGAAWHTYVPGLNDATVTVSRFFDSSSTGPIFLDRQLLNQPFYLELVLNSTDQSQYVCYGHVQSDQFTEDIGAVVAESVTFKPTGPVYFTT
jgi:hypothetical protein